MAEVRRRYVEADERRFLETPRPLYTSEQLEQLVRGKRKVER